MMTVVPGIQSVLSFFVNVISFFCRPFIFIMAHNISERKFMK
jgi:hypothetical protein